MEIRAPCLAFVIIGLAFAFPAVFVESQRIVSKSTSKPLPPLPPAPPPPPPPPPSPPPPLKTKEPSSWPPPPPPPHYKMETQSYQRPPPPPPPVSGKSKAFGRKRRRQPRPPMRRRNENKMNKGKIIGFVFAGVAAVLQAGVVGFLVFQRKQLTRIDQR